MSAFGGDVVSLGGTGIGRFGDRNVGTQKAVSVTGFSLGGAVAGDSLLVEPTGLQADIVPRVLGVTATAAGKVYDGTTAVGVTLADNRIAGDALILGYSSTGFADKNAGSGKAVGIGGISASGADAGNYSVATSAAATADVAPATLVVTARGDAKVYDATTNIGVTLADDRLTGDALVLNYGSASLGDKNAGTAKSVAVSGITLAGLDAGNYRFNSSATTTADVSKATLTVTAVVEPRSFDGSTAAGVTLADNRLAADQIVLAYGNAGFADAAVGTGKPVAVSGIRLAGGTDQGNYVLASTSASATGDIGQPPADTRSASVAPVLAPVAPVVVPTAPRGGVDLGLPGPVAAAGVSTTVAVPETAALATPPAGASDAGGGVWVALARPSGTNQDGAVTVSVPRTITAAGTGFSFPLPAEVAQVPGAEQARVTTVGGAALPQWLTFSGATKSFSASSAPAGALPIELVVRVGDRQWTVTVTERNGK